MRVTREKAAENRERIIDAASRLFRENGFDGVGIDAIMQEAGLTHGGFYGHFASKDELAAQALEHALQAGDERQGRCASLRDLVADYLSARHRDRCAKGCAVAALGAALARQGPGVRRVFTSQVVARLDRLSRLITAGLPSVRRKRAIATFAGLVGAMTLARAVDDRALSDEILAAARDIFSHDQP